MNRPTGAAACSHGWSKDRREPVRAEPVDVIPRVGPPRQGRGKGIHAVAPPTPGQRTLDGDGVLLPQSGVARTAFWVAAVSPRLPVRGRAIPRVGRLYPTQLPGVKDGTAVESTSRLSTRHRRKWSRRRLEEATLDLVSFRLRQALTEGA